MPIIPDPNDRTDDIPRPAEDMYRKFFAALARVIAADVTGTEPDEKDVNFVNGQPGGRHSEYYLTESIREVAAIEGHTPRVVKGEGEGM